MMGHDKKYILFGKTPVEADLLEWGKWFQDADRHVAQTEIGDFWISTVFLGLDHQFGEGPPLLFETMVFNKDRDDLWCERSSTWEEAEETHQRGVDYVRGLDGRD
jgi:hypothetical protein